MKIYLALIWILCFSGLITTAQSQHSQSINKASNTLSPLPASSVAKSKPAVLVELFTSEGCVTCPPADRLLAQLEKNQLADAEIITLALHIDYWDNIGWKDPFSSPLYSQRQDIYGHKFKMPTVYTPQMVVDGTKQFIGSNAEAAGRAISDSAKSPKATIDLSWADGALKIDVSELPTHSDATVFLAIAEDNLSAKVSGGENGGRTLEHSAVARDLKPLGRLSATDAKFEDKAVLPLQPDWKTSDLKVIVFVQENKSRRILGAARISADRK